MTFNIIPLQDITCPSQQLHVASMVAHVRPAYLVMFHEWLSKQVNENIQVEIHAESEQGKVVIVTESGAEKAIVDFLDDLRDQPGVLNAVLVYHEYLSAEDLRDEITTEEELL